MNLFNRILVILLMIAVGAAAIAIAVLAWTIPNRTINWLADAVQWLDDNDGDTEKALLTIGCVVAVIVALAVLILELVPHRRTVVAVTGVEGGAATLSTGAIAQRVEDAVRQVPDVADARAFVQARRKGVEVEMDLEVDPEANLAELTGAASAAARNALENRMHVALATPPRARLHYRELRLRRAGTPEPVDARNTSLAPAPVATPSDVTPEDEAAAPEAMPPRSEATEAGWRQPASPDNHEEAPQADTSASASEKSSTLEPETENKFE